MGLPEAPPVAGASPEIRAALDRWHAATRFKLAAQADVIRGRLEDALRNYAECARLNPDDHEAAKQREGVRLMFLK